MRWDSQSESDQGSKVGKRIDQKEEREGRRTKKEAVKKIGVARSLAVAVAAERKSNGTSCCEGEEEESGVRGNLERGLYGTQVQSIRLKLYVLVY